ncbi:glucose-6-phosphate dehydrogenase [Fimbriiglobus ruber]|uniref:Glucose-6-phosphate 1-dehydrogenase n=1 Tax=Fimbriiglobus ruber TaxID=1908690 RepID=A0A225DAM5_9BACT|nr:glucose-6-phosphate dehydrogenase [Fimbriiglobus ruber]OWK35598.1 Glucose-6-phosphate 1-dehydrogenase [Fimbriiglobus ruber]
MAAARSDAFVFFGATGDLAYKQIFPALQSLVRRGHLDMPIIGVAKSGWNLDQLKARAKDSLEKHGGLNQSAYDKLCSRLNYIDGDYADPATFSQIRQALGSAQRPLYYLAIPPSLFATVAEGLAKVDGVKNARVIVEKPFGRNLASAQELNTTLRRFFPEESIFRIDHYLGKEPVQNLIYFRFANPVVEASWDHKHIESVQITMAEHFGVAGRGKFYEEAGAIRDVVQNHMLQVIACLAMECPSGQSHEAHRDERGRLLQAVRTLTPNDVIRGQFRGYRSEPGVAPNSEVETFAALRFTIDNDRWSGVPFFVRAGKCLPVTATEAVVRYRRPERPVLDDRDLGLATYHRFRFSPEVVVAMGAKVKKPGECMVGEPTELIAHHQQPDEMQPYERLLGDAANGDGGLFARADSVEAAWRVVDPVLENVTPLHEYEPNTWGPAEAVERLAPEGGWHDPAAQEASP